MALAHTPHDVVCNSPVRRYLGAMLLLAIASLLTACGGGAEPAAGGGVSGGVGGGGGGGAVVCATGPSPAVLDWDPVTDPSLAGYRVYYGTSSGNYLQAAGAGLDASSNVTYTVTNLSIGTTYYFAVTDYASIPPKESDFSNEVCKTIS